MKYNNTPVAKSARIDRMIEYLYSKMPEIEADRAELVTESFKETEGLPMITRKAKAFEHIMDNLPIVLRPEELIVGSATINPRGCQVFPEFSFSWLEDEFETVATRVADPFYISDDTKKRLHEVYKYWPGKTTSELAMSYMAPEARQAIEHNVFTVGNYFYNGVGHVTVKYDEVIKIGYRGIINKAKAELAKCNFGDEDYASKTHFLNAVITSCEAVIRYAKRYSKLAYDEAAKCSDPVRKQELLVIAKNCENVPENGANGFYEACQTFWFVQMILQIESSGHSISPGRFDQYMYPYYEADIKNGKITREFAQELMDNIWIKLNDLNKVRDAASAEGFAGYGLFQNLIAGGQNAMGMDVTNDLSFMCLEATLHVRLPQPSLSVRIWNGTPDDFILKAAEVTREGMGVPAYYNDEVIIPALINRGLTMEEAREYNIIGCVEPQTPGKTEGWHDAAFFNMCRVLEITLANGKSDGVQIGPKTGDVLQMKSFDELFEAYKIQMEYMISLLVNADNAVDMAHMTRCPLPYESSMVDDCIAKGKSLQEGGAVYNFTGPQGFGIANVADALFAIKKLVFEDKKVSMAEYMEAVRDNFGKGIPADRAQEVTTKVVRELVAKGEKVTEEQIAKIFMMALDGNVSDAKKKRYEELLNLIDELPKYGNDIDEADIFAREVAYTYTRPLEKFRNPRGGMFQAGLYPVSANVPLGKQTGATPDGRLAGTPIADGVGPMSGRDTKGPTATANSVAKLDHFIASNGTLFNQKFHPSALKGQGGLINFAALVRAYFDKKGMHAQYNVVSRETLIDAQKNPEKYKNLVVRVAGYSALFTTLSRSLQDDIINRTEQGF
ncbi:MAG: glycyl radical protein [Lachnospiraceae bacterium]|nr:glycyl radical protein [Lachnospiraceae bacterium]